GKPLGWYGRLKNFSRSLPTGPWPSCLTVTHLVPRGTAPLSCSWVAPSGLASRSPRPSWLQHRLSMLITTGATRPTEDVSVRILIVVMLRMIYVPWGRGKESGSGTQIVLAQFLAQPRVHAPTWSRQTRGPSSATEDTWYQSKQSPSSGGRDLDSSRPLTPGSQSPPHTLARPEPVCGTPTSRAPTPRATTTPPAATPPVAPATPSRPPASVVRTRARRCVRPPVRLNL
ncbi:unnamed protein product, partial [Ixodes hexagonus]